ncbi:MAG: phosphoribosylformylglycinamidine synthase II, partial [Campylobacteraceae bacterium]|nr:phosphoribosylformylglycinamidine synthase II [Campylobacteraceae bacterium]
ILDRPISRPLYLDEIASKNIDDFPAISNQEAFEILLKDLEVVDKSWIFQQYDSLVQANTIKAPGSLDASVIRIRESGKAIAMSCDCNPRYNYIDPKGGAAAAVMESGRNVAMSGARPLAITDCLNYGNPENPEVMWQFAEGTYGIKEACLALNTPVVSGNVSLYNETNGISVFPTPAIAMVGVNEDANSVLPSSFTTKGRALYLVGETKHEFGGSLYLKALHNAVVGSLPSIDYKKELSLWQLVIEANKKKLISAAKDISIGGIAVTLAKMAAASNMGIKATLACKDKRDIFSESFSRAIVEVVDEAAFIELAQTIGISVEKIGNVGGKTVACNDVKTSLEALREIYFNRFVNVIEQDL